MESESKAKHKRILAIGARLAAYPRNKELLAAFARHAEVTSHELASERDVFGCLRALFRARNAYDAILMVQPAQRFAFALLLYRICFHTKIIGDAFTSAYDTTVNDRQLAGPISIKALYHCLSDFLFVQLADVLIVDTEEHGEYFHRMFSPRDKTAIVVVPVLIDMHAMDAVVPKRAVSGDVFLVVFWGYYIPLQGVEHIVRAAAQLKGEARIRFVLIGNGQTRPDIERLAKELDCTNISFLPRVPYDELLAHTKGADLVLGIFGDTEKARRVIPNKVVVAAALGKPIVTGMTPPMERHFADGEHVFFTSLGDPSDLAKTIMRAYQSGNLYDVGMHAAEVARSEFTTDKAAHVLDAII